MSADERIMGKIRPALAAVLGALVALAGCRENSTEATKRNATPVSVRTVPATSTEGFSKHWTLGPRSAWYSTERHEVIIADTLKGTMLKLTDLPRQYGRIAATGWEDNDENHFFIHFVPGSDSGTVVYIDLGKQVITKTEHWAAP